MRSIFYRLLIDKNTQARRTVLRRNANKSHLGPVGDIWNIILIVNADQFRKRLKKEVEMCIIWVVSVLAIQTCICTICVIYAWREPSWNLNNSKMRSRPQLLCRCTQRQAPYRSFSMRALGQRGGFACSYHWGENRKYKATSNSGIPYRGQPRIWELNDPPLRLVKKI